MKVIGEGSIHTYDSIDECPHAPGPEDLWSESLAIMLWDTEKNVHVFLHLTQEPNHSGGVTTVWLNAWTPEHTYHHSDDQIALKPGDVTKNSLTAGDLLCRYSVDSKHYWTVRDTDVSIDLVMDDYHPGFGYYPKSSGSFRDAAQKEHIESTGWITGSVTIKGKSYTVAGEGWRDHSWGKRDYQGILSHRANYALFGREFNFFGVTFLGRDGNLIRQGLIVRGDTLQVTRDFSVVAYVGEDGVSHIGSRVTLQFEGKTHEIEFTPVGKAVINFHQGCPICDSMCTVTMGDKTGVGLMETTFRAQGGTAKPFVFPFSPAILENGIYPR
jgi:hypothetical protein